MSPSSSLPRDWIPTLERFLQREPVVARVVVTEVRGSTPREPGAFMLVGHDEIEGSIGGGRLEWEAIAAARELLADSATPARIYRVVLAADVGQCCGGVVSVWLERFTRHDVPVLQMASEAGARGPAVLVSEATVDGMRRRVVRRQDVRGALDTPTVSAANGLVSSAAASGVSGAAGPARASGSSGAASSAAASAPSAASGLALASRASGAASPATASTERPTPIDHLLRQPRQVARPVVTTHPTGELTFVERLDDSLPSVWLYGAGHVGQALARILAELPLRLTWIDSRAELFPNTPPNGVRILQDPDSIATVSEAPVGTYFVVMSHSHPLDLELCHALLERNDFAWLGLIGSDSKAARFRSRLGRTGLGSEVIAKLVCPIGVEGITSKWPAAIAVAVAAQLMQKISAAAEQPELLPATAHLPQAAIAIQRPDFEGPPPAATSIAQNSAADVRSSEAASRSGAPAPAPLDAPCAPELCATCGSSADALERADSPDRLHTADLPGRLNTPPDPPTPGPKADDTPSSNNPPPTPRHETVTS